jgi:hypothetical protein
MPCDGEGEKEKVLNQKAIIPVVAVGKVGILPK